MKTMLTSPPTTRLIFRGGLPDGIGGQPESPDLQVVGSGRAVSDVAQKLPQRLITDYYL